VLSREAHPSLAQSGLVLDTEDNSLQLCVPSSQALSVSSISVPLYTDPTLSTGEVWSGREKMRPWRLETGCYDDDCFYYHSWRNNVVIAFGTLSNLVTNPVLTPEFMMDTSLFVVAHLKLVTTNVLSVSESAPSMTFEWLASVALFY